jgi:uncharacterized protein (DUF927 family)
VDWGLLPWSKGEALDAIKKCFDAWLENRGGTGAAEDTEMVMLFIEQHGQSRFQDIGNTEGLCINRAGFRDIQGGRTIYYIMPENFKAEICKGVDHKRAAPLLVEKGVMLAGDSRSNTRKPPIVLPGWGRKRCYTIEVGGENELD